MLNYNLPLLHPSVFLYISSYTPFLLQILKVSKSKGLPQQAEVAQGVPGRLRPRIFLTFRHYKGGRSSAIRTGRLYPRRNPWYLLSEAESTSGHMVLSGVPRKKSPVTSPGIDPGTVRLVAQRLNHYATPGSLLQILHILIPANIWYHWWHKQHVTCISTHTISAHHPWQHARPHNLPVTTSLEHWLLYMFLTFNFKIVYPICLISHITFYTVNAFLNVTIIYTVIPRLTSDPANEFFG